MRKTTVYPIHTAKKRRYIDIRDGYTFEKNGLQLQVYKFAPSMWFVIDPLTGLAMGVPWPTRAKALQHGASEYRCSKLAEYRKTDEYAKLRKQYTELKGGVA